MLFILLNFKKKKCLVNIKRKEFWIMMIIWECIEFILFVILYLYVLLWECWVFWIIRILFLVVIFWGIGLILWDYWILGGGIFFLIYLRVRFLVKEIVWIDVLFFMVRLGGVENKYNIYDIYI